MSRRTFVDRRQMPLFPAPVPVKDRIRALENNIGHVDVTLFSILKHPMLDDPRAKAFFVRIGALEAHVHLAALAARNLLDDLNGLEGGDTPQKTIDDLPL